MTRKTGQAVTLSQLADEDFRRATSRQAAKLHRQARRSL